MLWVLEDELEVIFYMSPISLAGMVVVVPLFLGLDYGAADLIFSSIMDHPSMHKYIQNIFYVSSK